METRPTIQCIQNALSMKRCGCGLFHWSLQDVVDIVITFRKRNRLDWSFGRAKKQLFDGQQHILATARRPEVYLSADFVEGVKRMVTYKSKPVVYRGQIVYEIEFDSQLIVFLLKNYDRKRFGDTTFGPNWNGNLEDLPEESLKQVLQRLEGQVAAKEAKQLKQAQTIDVQPTAVQTVDIRPESPTPLGRPQVKLKLMS